MEVNYAVSRIKTTLYNLACHLSSFSSRFPAATTQQSFHSREHARSCAWIYSFIAAALISHLLPGRCHATKRGYKLFHFSTKVQRGYRRRSAPSRTRNRGILSPRKSDNSRPFVKETRITACIHQMTLRINFSHFISNQENLSENLT